MKINKLMLAMAVAASAFAACNKQETTPQVENQVINKSIVLNIANVMPGTKDPGSTIKDDTQVQLNSYQVFFSDGEDLYAPKTVTAELLISLVLKLQLLHVSSTSCQRKFLK